MHYWVWLALAGAFVVLEILTLSLIFFSFAVAALLGAIGAAMWVGSSLQWIVFAVAAVLSLAVVRPIVRKYLFRKSSGGTTGVAALLNQGAVTLTEVSRTAGTIRLRNETSSADADRPLHARNGSGAISACDGKRRSRVSWPQLVCPERGRSQEIIRGIWRFGH